MTTDLKRIVEALLFAAEAPLSLAQIAQVLETSDKDRIKTALAELGREYDYLERAFALVEVAGGWRLRTRPEMAFWLRKLKRQSATRLSRAALETLAIIAYKQPVLKAEIERIRGVEVSGVLRMLMEKDLVRVVGRKDLPGRPLIYGTTKRFLEVFDLKDLSDLPTLEEMQELLGEPEEVSEAGGEGPGEEAPLFSRGMAGQDEHDSAGEQEAQEQGPPPAEAGEPPAPGGEGLEPGQGPEPGAEERAAAAPGSDREDAEGDGGGDGGGEGNGGSAADEGAAADGDEGQGEAAGREDGQRRPGAYGGPVLVEPGQTPEPRQEPGADSPAPTGSDDKDSGPEAA